MSTVSYKDLVLFKKIKAHHTLKEYDKNMTLLHGIPILTQSLRQLL